MTIEFDENKYEFIKCEAGEEQRASFWFKPKDLDLTPENKSNKFDVDTDRHDKNRLFEKLQKLKI